MGRYVAPGEIANTVLFLCSDLACAITGAQYVVDGVRTATGGAVTQALQSRGKREPSLRAQRSNLLDHAPTCAEIAASPCGLLARTAT